MQVLYNNGKSIEVIHCNSRLKEKEYVVIWINAVNAFDKTQHPRISNVFQLIFFFTLSGNIVSRAEKDISSEAESFTTLISDPESLMENPLLTGSGMP